MRKCFCDILIIGGGIIGASLAIRLAQFGIKVIIIDHKLPNIAAEHTFTPPTRTIAINYTSVKFFKNINIWKEISPDYYNTYHKLEMWEWLSSKVTFHSMSLGISEMGRIIENNRLQSALWKIISSNKTITLYCPSTLASIQHTNSLWKCTLNNNITIISRLLIGADGAHSQIRKILGIGITGWKYNQHCMLLTITSKKCDRETIWQVFTSNGPIGFLPLHNHWGSLMWYDTPEHIHYLKQLPQSILEKKIENNFYEQLGHIKLHNSFVVPLICQDSYNYITSTGGILIGDAAHVLHPLAGQGINLGIRDVICLSNLLIKSRAFDEPSNIIEILHSYQSNQKNDSFFMQTSINWCYFVFCNNFLPLKIIRNSAFLILEHSQYLKNQILKYASGIF